MNKKLSVILISVLALIAIIFSSCSKKEPEYGIHRKGSEINIVLPSRDAPVKLKAQVFDPSVIASYTYVRPEICGDETIKATTFIRDALKEFGGGDMVGTDWIKPGDEPPADTLEILIGSTNRAESPAFHTLRICDYIIKFENNRLIICGGSDAATYQAAECFINNFIDREAGEVLIPKNCEYVFRAPGTPADSFKVNGVELCDYQIINEAFNSPNALTFLEDFVTEVTNFVPIKKSENKIIINNEAADGTCSITVDGTNIIVSGSNAVDASMVVRFFISHISGASGFSANKIGQNLSASINGTLSMNEADFANQDAYVIHVAPNGSDDNDGSADAPLATFEGARIRVREAMRFTTKPISVQFASGDYFMSETVHFDSNDSGNILAPVTYGPADGATANFIGGLKIDPSRITKAMSSTIVDRVIDKDAASKLMQIDLNGIIDSYHKDYSFGNTDNNEVNGIQIYVGGNPLDRSRWPNGNIEDKYIRAESKMTVNEDGSKTFFFDKAAGERMKLWSEDVKKDLYMMTYFAWEWTNEVHTAEKLDLQNLSVTFDGSINYWDDYDGGGRYYFYNLPEEIDVPGECYIDRENLIVYFLPDEDYNPDDVYISTMTDSMIKMTNTKHIVIDGLNFMYSRGRVIETTSVEDFTISNSTLAHTSSNTMYLKGLRINVLGNHIYDTARGGLRIDGGDRKDLISGESLIENNEIHDINRDESPYNPAILVHSVGLKIRHNKLYHSTHLMIRVNTNDVLIEYNEIFDCVLDAADAGAINSGRDPSIMGTVIRYNYFHNIGNPYDEDNGQQAIFNDDGNNGMLIYGNVFWQATYNKAAVKSNGAQFMNMYNNIYIDMPYAFSFNGWINSGDVEKRSERWWTWLYDKREETVHGIVKKLNDVKFDSELWREHYKDTIWAQLYNYIDSEKIDKYYNYTPAQMAALAPDNAPEGSNLLHDNVIVNINNGNSEKYYTGSGLTRADRNYVTMDYSIFKEYGKDFTLTDAALAEIRKISPDFEQVPFEKMGLLD